MGRRILHLLVLWNVAACDADANGMLYALTGHKAPDVVETSSPDVVETSSPDVEIEWITLPAGTFQMGSTRSGDEQPVHTVTVSSFRMAKTETTQAQYAACVKAGACSEAGTGSSYCTWGKAGREQHPVNCVTWYQADDYCEWAGARLCTEAEWEYAARSGGQNRTYPWGDQTATCSYAVMYEGGNGCGTGGTWAVCSKTAGNSTQGACDLAGNVWEWVADWYGDYPSEAQTNPTGPVSGSHRVSRGGSWDFDADGLRAAYRDYVYPGYYYYYLGLRCCRSSN